MNQLSDLIAQKEQECTALAHRLEISQAELRILKLAAETISGGVAKESSQRPMNGSGHEQPRRWGKTLWSLSEPYRRLVEAIIAKDNPAMNSYQISALAKTIGLELTP